MQREYYSVFSDFEIEIPLWVTVVGLAMLAVTVVAAVSLVMMYLQRRTDDE